MAVPTEPLVRRLVASVVPPGATTAMFPSVDDDEDGWRLVLANAFWSARLQSYFTEYRLSAEYDEILTVVGDDDMPDELQQLIVKVAAVEVVLAKMLEVQTKFRAKSGDNEFETEQSATVLKAILDALRADLAALKDQLVNDTRFTTSIGLVDMAVARSVPGSTWVGA